MVAKTVTNVEVGPSGQVYFTFSDGSQREMAGHSAGLSVAQAIDADADLVERLLIAKAYRHSPDGTALADIIGSTIVIDTNAESPVQFNFSQAVQ